MNGKKDFNVIYQILNSGDISFTQSGDFNGKPYNASVKMTCRATEVVEHEVFGKKASTTTVEFKIPCANDADMKIFKDWLWSLDLSKAPLVLTGSMPRATDQNGFYKVVSSSFGAEVMHAYQKKNGKPA